MADPYADSTLNVIGKASLKPFQRLRCVKELVVQRRLYAVANSLGVIHQAEKLDKEHVWRVKKMLYLPGSFLNSHIWLPVSQGGLGVLNLSLTAVSVQLKALARLTRLADPFVDVICNAILQTHMDTLCDHLRVPSGVTSYRELNKMLDEAKGGWYNRLQQNYTRTGLFAHAKDPLSNRWHQADNRYMKDGDRIRALRLRTGVYQCRALFNKHAKDPAQRLCHHCGLGDETPAHILQFCERTHGPRVERHNFCVIRQAGSLLNTTLRPRLLRRRCIPFRVLFTNGTS